MRIENGKVVMGTRACIMCRNGQVATIGACRTCHGTGCGKRGGRGGCKACQGTGQGTNWAQTKPCGTCHGTGSVAETIYDYMPREIYQQLPIRVYRQDRQNSFNEALLALGCLYSTTDYGAAWAGADADVARDVRAASPPQACKVVQPDGTLAEALAVIVTTNGYSVRAVFPGADVCADAARELPYATGMALGRAIYQIGGNGTLAAAAATTKK